MGILNLINVITIFSSNLGTSTGFVVAPIVLMLGDWYLYFGGRGAQTLLLRKQQLKSTAQTQVVVIQPGFGM